MYTTNQNAAVNSDNTLSFYILLLQEIHIGRNIRNCNFPPNRSSLGISLLMEST